MVFARWIYKIKAHTVKFAFFFFFCDLKKISKDAIPFSITLSMSQVQIAFVPWIFQVLLSVLINTKFTTLLGISNYITSVWFYLEIKQNMIEKVVAY